MPARAARRRCAVDWRAGFGEGVRGGTGAGRRATTGEGTLARALSVVVVAGGASGASGGRDGAAGAVVSPGSENDTGGSGGRAPLPGIRLTGPHDRHTGVSEGSSFPQRLQIKRAA